jgi:hypothetical protein
MTDDDPATAAGREALDVLRLMLEDPDVTDASRVSAAKALLDRFAPKDDAELKRREAEERAAAIAEARCLLAELAELAAAAAARADAPPALVEDGAAGATDSTDNAPG